MKPGRISGLAAQLGTLMVMLCTYSPGVLGDGKSFDSGLGKMTLARNVRAAGAKPDWSPGGSSWSFANLRRLYSPPRRMDGKRSTGTSSGGLLTGNWYLGKRSMALDRFLSSELANEDSFAPDRDLDTSEIKSVNGENNSSPVFSSSRLRKRGAPGEEEEMKASWYLGKRSSETDSVGSSFKGNEVKFGDRGKCVGDCKEIDEELVPDRPTVMRSWMFYRPLQTTPGQKRGQKPGPWYLGKRSSTSQDGVWYLG